MTRHILIMRHGLAKSGRDDFSRELKEKGKRDAQRMGVWLAQQDLVPQIIWASSAMRTTTTAEKCIKAAGLSTDHLTTDISLYNSDTATLLRCLARTPDTTDIVLLVAHNPGVTQLAYTLAGDALNRSDLMGALAPGMMVHVTVDQPWESLHHMPHPIATMKTVIDPDTLPRDFPFPDTQGTERRPRPSYYYSQACALPYRMTPTGPEVLIITSSSGRHWTLPKGIIDPGKSGAEAACQEAWEEAGIRGTTDPIPLSHITQEKWEGVCTIALHAMEVSDMAPEDQWEENHRKRQWMPPSEAAAQLRNPDLAAVVARFTGPRP